MHVFLWRLQTVINSFKKICEKLIEVCFTDVWVGGIFTTKSYSATEAILWEQLMTADQSKLLKDC